MSTAAAATLAGRRHAEALMVDACTVTQRTGVGTLNETTGAVTTPTATVYTGKCRVQSAQPQPRTAEVVERTATMQGLTVSIPVSATAVRVGAVVQITASALDAELVGSRFLVTGVHHKTHATARRLQCEEATA